MGIDAHLRALIGDALREVLPEVIGSVVPSADRPALLTRKQAARALQVHPATLDRLRAQGLPTVMVCDSPRFELVEVLAWLKEQGK